MKINSLNLIFVWGFILFFILPPKISAETLTTVSGKVYNNYKFIDFYADQVLVSHAEGFTFLKYTDLPKDIREQYSREIKGHNLQSPLKKFARLQLTTASQNANPLRAIRQLTKIKNQYSSYPEIIAEFDKAILKKQQEIAIEKILGKNADPKTPSKQYLALKQMLPNVADPGLIKEINFFLEKENNFLKQISEVLDVAISDAAELEVSSMFFQRFDDIKKVVTTYLANEQKESYLAKINKLVSAKQDEMQSEIESNKEQIALIVQKHQDAQTRLNKLFQQEENIDHQLGQKIIEDTIKLETAIRCSQSENDYERALEILKTSFENSQYAVNKNKAKMALANLEEAARKERLRRARIAKMQKIQLNNDSNGSFVINKGATDAKWTLYIIPIENRNEAQIFLNLFKEVNEQAKIYVEYSSKAEYTSDLRTNVEYRKISVQALKRSNAAIEDIEKWENYMKQNGLMRAFTLPSGTYAFSNLNFHAHLIAREPYVKDATIRFYYYYKEYQPGKTGNQWNIE